MRVYSTLAKRQRRYFVFDIAHVTPCASLEKQKRADTENKEHQRRQNASLCILISI